jgi:hypothetical protein
MKKSLVANEIVIVTRIVKGAERLQKQLKS